MKQGRTLTELALEIERQAQTKRDFVAPTKAMQIVPIKPSATEQAGGVALALANGDVHKFGINDLAHRQIGEWAKVPAPYYDRMLAEAPELLAQNLNTWLSRSDDKRMVRTLDGKARGVLSDRYRPLDNFDLSEAVLPTLLQMELHIMSCEVTERRFYIKAVDKRILRDIPKGAQLGQGHVIFDTCSPALTISNSEVGYGALSIQGGVWTEQCTNLATFQQRSLRKYHVGGKHDIGEEVYAMLSDQTRRITDASVWAQVRDVVKIAFDTAKFDALLEDVRGAAEQKIGGDPVKVVELVSERLGINETERKSVLRHLIEGGDLSRYGLFNAVTRTAEDLESYDRATEFEALGGKLIELPRNDWQQLAEAA